MKMFKFAKNGPLVSSWKEITENVKKQDIGVSEQVSSFRKWLFC